MTGHRTTWFPGKITALSSDKVTITWDDESGSSDDLPIVITRDPKRFKILHEKTKADTQAASLDQMNVIPSSTPFKHVFSRLDRRP